MTVLRIPARTLPWLVAAQHLGGGHIMARVRLWSKVVVVGLVVLGVLAVSHRAQADVKLPKVIGSHMVLQQKIPLPIWGTADAGEEVTVTIGDNSASTKAGADGKWSVKLQEMS